MDIFKLCAIAIISVVLIITVKQQMSNISIIIALASGILIFMMIVPVLEEVLTSLLDIVETLDIGTSNITIILKIIGISYICEFCSQICIDSGESAIASKIDLGGKVLIMVISMPIITELLSLITSLMP